MDLENLPASDEQHDGVWPEHVEAVLAFLSIQTQWRRESLPMGGSRITGLDYTGARAGLEMAGFDITPDLWCDVIMIEAGALDARNGDH